MMMTRKGFFAALAAAIAGTTKAAPEVWQEKVCTAVVGRTAIVADAEAMAIGQAWLQEVQTMNDGNVEWSSAEYTINLRATGDGDMIYDSGNYWQIR